MNISYAKVKEYNVSDFPLVLLDIDIIFGFRTSPNYQTVIDLQQLTTTGGTNEELIRLAAESILYVQTPDGEKYDLTTVEAVEIFVDETDIEFLRSVMVSWFVLTFTELERAKKINDTLGALQRQRASKRPSRGIVNQLTRQLPPDFTETRNRMLLCRHLNDMMNTSLTPEDISRISAREINHMAAALLWQTM